MANPNRPRGTGKGTERAWREAGMEGGPPVNLPATDNQEQSGEESPKPKKLNRRDLGRGKLLKQMEGKGPALKYDAPPRKTGTKAINTPKPEIPKGQINAADIKPGKENKTSVYRTGPTIETALRERTKTEGEKLKEHIGSIVEKFDFLDCLKKDKYEFSDEQGEKIGALIQKEKEAIIQQIISYLFKEYGEGSVKNLISKNTFPELEYFEDELRDIAVCYYDMVSETGKKNTGTESIERREADLEEYSDDVLEDVSETLLKAIDQKELGLKIEVEEAVDEKINEILREINSIRHKLKKSGVNLDMLDKEIQDIRGKGRIKIIKHCLVAFSPEGKEKVWGNREEQIAFWASYFTESAFKHLGGDDLRKAYFRAFPKSYEKIERGKPAKIISRPLELPKEEPKITIEQILVSDGLKEIYAAIEEYLLDELQKIREADKQRVNLTEDERAVLEEFLQGQYEEKFIPGGAIDSEEARLLFKETIIQSIEKS